MPASGGLGLLCAEELTYSKCNAVTFYGIGSVWLAKWKSGSWRKVTSSLCCGTAVPYTCSYHLCTAVLLYTAWSEVSNVHRGGVCGREVF